MSINKYKKFIAKYKEVIKYESIKINDLEEYKDGLPFEIFEVLREEGISNFMNGFLWTINPKEYADWLNEWLKFDTVCVPFARTALGDVFFMKDGRIALLHSNKALVEFVTKKVNWFFDRFLCDDEYVDKYFDRTLYKEVDKESQNTLNFDECFGFEPILSLGGDEKVENLRKVKLREYLHILSQADGEVNFIKV